MKAAVLENTLVVTNDLRAGLRAIANRRPTSTAPAPARLPPTPRAPRSRT